MTTIKEIAEMAGVSMTTVYNVLHGNVKKVSKENMEKIQKLLDEYHYVPKMGLSALVVDIPLAKITISHKNSRHITTLFPPPESSGLPSPGG